MRKNKTIEFYNNSILIRGIYWALVNFIAILFLIPLYLIKPFKFVKLFRLKSERIGHLAGEAELFLRRIELKKIDNKGIRFVGIASTTPSNRQVLKMFKRRIKIVQIPQPPRLRLFFRSLFSRKSLLGKSPFFQELSFNSNEYPEFNKAKPSIAFTNEEESNGKELLRKMGVENNSWFVCFHGRDSAYLRNIEKVDTDEYRFRDVDIQNYKKAAEYITSKKGFAVRMGDVVKEKLQSSNKKIIDYATKYRTDFGDIYLLKKCKFFVGSTTGLWVIPEMFSTPVVITNLIPMKYPPCRASDLFIPKKLWSKKKKRFLTFKEILNSGIIDFVDIQDYKKAGIDVIENTPEEIFDIVNEMNSRLDGTFKYTKEDEKLQKKFHSLIKPKHSFYGAPSSIGAKFLRQNKNLLS